MESIRENECKLAEDTGSTPTDSFAHSAVGPNDVHRLPTVEIPFELSPARGRRLARMTVSIADCRRFPGRIPRPPITIPAKIIFLANVIVELYARNAPSDLLTKLFRSTALNLSGRSIARPKKMSYCGKSGRHDSNVRLPAPKAGALARLSYAPVFGAVFVEERSKHANFTGIPRSGQAPLAPDPLESLGASMRIVLRRHSGHPAMVWSMALSFSHSSAERNGMMTCPDSPFFNLT